METTSFDVGIEFLKDGQVDVFAIGGVEYICQRIKIYQG